MAEIYWTSLAKRHLQEIDAYIAEGTPFYSIIFIDKLLASAEKIGQFPEMGRIVPEFDMTEKPRVLQEAQYKSGYETAEFCGIELR